METYVTNPQPSGNPLNLLYKGVFSTRLKAKNKSLYGHYLDKLYQVQFLGIGTYSASVLPDIVNAVMLKQTSIGGSVDMYNVTRGKYRESVVLEALGGNRKFSDDNSILTDTTAHRLDVINQSTVLDSLFADSLADIGSLNLHVSASQLRKVIDIIDSLVKANRVEDLKSAEIYPLLLTMTVFSKTASFDPYLEAVRSYARRQTHIYPMLLMMSDAVRQMVVGAEESMSRSVFGAIHERNLNDLYSTSLVHARVDDVLSAIKSAEGHVGGYAGDFESFIPNASQLTDFNGLLVRAADVSAVEHLAEVKARNGEIDKVSYMGYRTNVLKQAEQYVNLDEAFKVKVAEYLADVLFSQVPLREEAVILSDMNALGVLLRRADVSAEMAYVMEKVGRQAVRDVFDLTGENARVAAIAHYLLYKENANYKTAIDSTIAKYLDSYKVDAPAISKALEKLGETVTDKFKARIDSDYDAAVKALEAVEGKSELQFNRLVYEAGRNVETLLDGYKKSAKPVEINFDHDIQAEESVRYMEILDSLYDSFQKMLRPVDVASPMDVTGITPDRDALVVEQLVGTGLARSVIVDDSVHGLRVMLNESVVDDDIYFASVGSRAAAVEEDLMTNPTVTNIGIVDEESILRKTVETDAVVHEFEWAHRVTKTDNDIVSYESGKSVILSNTVVEDDVTAEPTVIVNTVVEGDIPMHRVNVKQASVMDYDSHGEMWSELPLFVGDSREVELFAELTSEQEVLTPDFASYLVAAELTDEEQVLAYGEDSPLFGELSSEPKPLSPETSTELFAELTDAPQALSFAVESELQGELANEPTKLEPELYVEVLGKRVLPDKDTSIQDEYEIAVLSCSEPNLKYRRRPPLEPDKYPEDPLFEWVCTEGYVCDDWLIVPLKDFNFENPDQDGFYDPVTFEPYFPTGQEDEDGDPYVLPPYSILNEPISNGADVGGKEPMAIDPCNLYSFIQYVVKIYDSYKSRFHASSPIDTMSRVMNLLFEQVEKLISEWDETKSYTPDELWRIYRFIRWMALGLTHRFYRVKVEYVYGDFVENFEVYPFSKQITTEGTVRKWLNGYGWTLEGHPILDSEQNNATFEFSVPKKTNSSTISFEIGNINPDRPDELVQGGVLFREDFEGVTFQINGDGWVPVQTQSGRGLGVEEPARVKTYRTSLFNVPAYASAPRVSFNYGVDTNMDSKLLLKKSDGTVVWQSVGVVDFGSVVLNPIEAGDYYFEIDVPQSESSSLRDISFTAQQIQNEWQKVGYITNWRVDGNVIYEEENTPGMAMVINPQWMQDSEYELEVEFYTEDVRANYGLIDWLGVVLNYRDANNYYLFGTWSSLDSYAKGGLQKVVNGQGVYQVSNPTWQINPDFRFRLGHWHKLRVVVNRNKFTIYIDGTRYLDITDPQGWGFGASGLAAYSNPLSSFRNFKYKGKPRFHAYIDNVTVESTSVYVPVKKPKYLIDFYLDGDSVPRIADYSAEAKRAYSFPIMLGEHTARWVFKKQGDERSISADASFVDNITVKGIKVVGAEVVEEFISCGGHLAVKLLIENLLEYYRRHHQGCKGERNIWIVE